MLPDRVSNPGPLTYESGALPTALRGPAKKKKIGINFSIICDTVMVLVLCTSSDCALSKFHLIFYIHILSDV